MADSRKQPVIDQVKARLSTVRAQFIRPGEAPDWRGRFTNVIESFSCTVVSIVSIPVASDDSDALLHLVVKDPDGIEHTFNA